MFINRGLFKIQCKTVKIVSFRKKINNFNYLLRRFSKNTSYEIIFAMKKKVFIVFLYFSLAVVDILRMKLPWLRCHLDRYHHLLLMMIDGSQKSSSLSRGHLEGRL